MRRLFSSPLVALSAGLLLRLFFVLRFPAESGDAAIYEQIATNWVKHGMYAMDVDGVATPVDMRMPGYPAFLALIYAITGRIGPAARLYVMLGQAAIDLLACVVIAGLAALIAKLAFGDTSPRRAFVAGLWLAVLCPFTANYAAVVLTETLAIFLTTVATVLFVMVVGSRSGPRRFSIGTKHYGIHDKLWASLAGLAVGLATLLRPESPLFLVAAWLALLGYDLRRQRIGDWLRICAYSGICCALALAPWAMRNGITLHEFQPLAPKNSNLPGELVPYGFMAWEKTWLFRMKDCYLVPWKLNGEAIKVDEIPKRAFDTTEEKRRVAMILEQYNRDLALTADEDAAFGQLARERTARHPLRTYAWLPLARAAVIWFTPRIELLPVSGHVFPLGYYWEEDRMDQRVTSGLFLLNLGYLLLGAWGAICTWKRAAAARPVVLFFAVFIALRTAFLTTLETPEPRYVLVCFPILMALAVQVFLATGQRALQASPSGSG